MQQRSIDIRFIPSMEKLIIKKIKQTIYQYFDNSLKIYIGKSYDDNLSNAEMQFDGVNYKIVLPGAASNEEIRSVFLLAHEYIHLISPVNRNEVIYFEEGLAMKFQFDIISEYNFFKYPGNETYYSKALKYIKEKDLKYFNSLNYILDLQKITNSNIYSLCRKLFDSKAINNFSQITPEILRNEFLITGNDDLLNNLCRKFY